MLKEYLSALTLEEIWSFPVWAATARQQETKLASSTLPLIALFAANDN